MRHEARLSSAVPHSTAFLPPAFIATLPPMHEASAEVGSTANTKPARSAASATRWVTTPASVQTVATSRSTPGRRDHLDLGHRLELLGVDDRAVPGQRNGAAGVAGAAAARDDGQAELDAAGDERGHLGLGVGREHDERVLDAPVGGVGHVRDAAQAVELDVVLGGDAAEHARRARRRRSATASNCAAKPSTAARGGLEQLADQRVARRRRPPACGASRSRRGGGAARRSAARGGAGCRAGRPAGRGCAARPRCRPAPRRACARSGRSGARRAAGSAASQARAPSRRMTISRSENEV